MILLVIDTLSGGGAERVTANLANYLVERGPVGLATLFDVPDAFPLDPRVRRIRFRLTEAPQALGRSWPQVQFLWQAIRFRQVLKECAPKVCLCFMETANLIGGLASWLTRIPFLISERCHPKDLVLTSLNKRFHRGLIYRLAAGFVAQSSATAEWARQFLPARRIHILPNPLAVGCGAPTPPREKRLLAVGRLAEGKGFAELLEVFAGLAGDFPDWKLRLVGQGPLGESLAQRAAQHDLQGRVEFVGWVDGMEEEYRKAAAFVLFSFSEGLPNALLEALHFGLPCVVSDCFPDCRRLLCHEKDALIVPVGNLNRLESCLRRILAEHQLRVELGQSGTLRSRPFALDQAGPRWSELLLRTARK